MADYQYYYGSEAEQFNFFRLPKRLIRDKQFRGISCEAKILYGVMLDRMTLSAKNGWIDSENRIYIIFTVADVAEEFGCSERKAKMLMNELDTSHGIGLIEKKRRGLGKPNLIYVKNFNSSNWDEETEKGEADCGDGTYPVEQDREENRSAADHKITAERKEEGEVQPVQKCKNLHVKRCKDMHVQKCKDVPVQKCKNLHVKRCKNMHPNKTDMNETDSYNNNLSIHLSGSRAGPPGDLYPDARFPDEGGWMDRQLVMGTLKRKLGYEILCMDYPQSRERIEELFRLMADACCYSGSTMPIGRNMVSVQEVRSRFMGQMTVDHMRYVLHALDENTAQVKNIRMYLLVCLYNAPATMHSFYHSLVQYDQYG